MLEKAINDILSGDSTIYGMTGDRIAPMNSAQGDIQPRIAYLVSADEPNNTFTGPSAFFSATVEIDAIADTYKKCAQLSGEIKRVFDGVIVNTSDVRIIPSRLTDESDIEQGMIDGAGKPVYLRTLTFSMLYMLLN